MINMKRKRAPTLVDLLKSTGSQNKKDAHVRGNAAGAHQKDINKLSRRQNKQEERDTERDWVDGELES